MGEGSEARRASSTPSQRIALFASPAPPTQTAPVAGDPEVRLWPRMSAGPPSSDTKIRWTASSVPSGARIGARMAGILRSSPSTRTQVSAR